MADDENDFLNKRRYHQSVSTGDVTVRSHHGEPRLRQLDRQFSCRFFQRADAHSNGERIAARQRHTRGFYATTIACHDGCVAAKADDLALGRFADFHSSLDLLVNPFVIPACHRVCNLSRGEVESNEAQIHFISGSRADMEAIEYRRGDDSRAVVEIFLQFIWFEDT